MHGAAVLFLSEVRTETSRTLNLETSKPQNLETPELRNPGT
jgi:hypothetical protein